MLSAREADLDARIFRQLLGEFDQEIDSLEEDGKRIERDDIAQYLKAGTFIPIYDRETDLITYFVEILEPSSKEGSENWGYVAETVSEEAATFLDRDEEVLASIAAEITASVERVLRSARLAMQQHKAAPKQRVPSSRTAERLVAIADDALSVRMGEHSPHHEPDVMRLFEEVRR